MSPVAKTESQAPSWTLAPLAALLLIFTVAACQPLSDGRCESFEAYLSQPARTVHFVELDGQLHLVALGYYGASWFAVADNGELSATVGEVPHALTPGRFLARQHLVVPQGDGLRLVTERSSIYLAAGNRRGREVPFTAGSPLLPSDFIIERVFPVAGRLFALWLGSTDDVGQTTAGLAEITSDDVVVPLGSPFWVGPRPSEVSGLRFTGAFDAASGRFRVDLPGEGERRSLELDRYGNIVATSLVATPGRYYLHWLPHRSDASAKAAASATGITAWSGLHSGTWCRFTLGDRSGLDCEAVSTREVPGRSHVSTQFQTSTGEQWVAVTTRDGIVVRRFNARLGMLDMERYSPHQVGECHVPMTDPGPSVEFDR